MTLKVRVEWTLTGTSFLWVPAHLIRLAVAAVGPDEEPDQDTFELLPEYQEWLAEQLIGDNLNHLVNDWDEKDAPTVNEAEQEGDIEQSFFDADTARRQQQ